MRRSTFLAVAALYTRVGSCRCKAALPTRIAFDSVKTVLVQCLDPTTAPVQVRLNDFSRLWAEVGRAAEQAFSRVGESGWYVLGRNVEALEAALAQFTRLEHAVGCANGLDAIEIGLRALDLKPGEPVLTTPLSAFATTLAILRAGGRPVFVDIDEHGLLDLELAEQALATDPSLRVMVPVHLYGRSLNLRRLAELKERFDLRIVEDIAQAVGAVCDGRPVGSVGQLAALSFYPTKNLGCLGDGGAVLTQEAALAERSARLRDYGQSAKYVHTELGLNSRLDEVQAAILREAMLPELARWTQARRATAHRYGQEIRHPNVQLPAACQESVWHLYVLRCEQREELAQHLAACGVQTAVHYPGLISEQEALSHLPRSGPTPKAQRWADSALSLPIHPYLSEQEQRQVIEAVNSWSLTTC